MKAILRLLAGLCPDQELSVVSNQPSAMSRPRSASYQRSAMSRQVSAISKLIPKTQYLLPKKELSAVSNQPSDTRCHVRAMSKLIPKTQYLISIFFLVFVSCGAVLAQEPVVHTAPAAKAETSKLNRLIHHLRYLACFVLLLFFVPKGAKGQKKQDSRHEYVTEENAIKRAIGVDKDADIINFPLVKYNPDYSGITGLKIGDKIPDELWDMPLWVVNHPEGKDTIRLREYESEKLLVLDFWARFCSPCIKSMDTWDGYVDKTNGQVKLIGVQLDYDYRALRTSEKQGWKSPSVIGNEAYLINRYFFDRNVVSRMAWIKDGKLLAVTSVRGYDFDTIQKVLNNEPVTIPIDSNWTYFNTNTLNQ